jgi:transcription termination/antitermination protein NusG
MDKKWYIVNVQTSCEAIAKSAIIERVKSNKMDELFGEVLVPTENVVELVKGQKQTRAKKFFPGYIFVQMVMTEDTWHLVRGASKVTGFVGSSSNKMRPPEVPEEQVRRVTQQMEDGAVISKPKANFVVGETVTVCDGPFNNFTGVVEEINDEKAKVKVSVSIFGRPTPVELDFIQVQKN